MRFEDYNSLLFEWYKDESKYDNIVKLWNSKLCISKLKDESDAQINERLKYLNISDVDNFISDFKDLVNNSIESKSSDIKNYLKRQYKDFYDLIEVTKNSEEDIKKSDIPNKEILESNLKNIAGELVKKSFPLVKNYISKKFLNLNVLSKLQLKSGMLNKLKNNIITVIKNSENKSIFSDGLSFNTLSTLVNSMKNGNLIETIIKETGVYYSNPTVAITTLAMSFLNLANSIKSYHKCSVDTENKIKGYTEKSNEINENFERHKKEIGLLNLDNYEESLKKIIDIGKKINNDKQELITLIDKIENDEKISNDEEKKSVIKSIAKNGLGLGAAVVGTVVTGGLAVAFYGAAAVVNDVSIAFNIAELQKIKEKLKFYQSKLKESREKEKEIELSLKELEKKYIQIQQRFIPINVG